MRPNDFKIKSRVRFSEVDPDRKMRIPAIINWLQDTGTAQSEALGVGFEYCLEHGKAWILSHWQVVIEEYPKLDQEITIYTWASGFDKFFGYRNYAVQDEEGRILLKATALWIYMDIRKQRPAKPDEHEIQAYGVGDPLEMDYAPRKIKAGEQGEKLPEFPVRRSDIDTNNHVNNCQYIRMALDVLPEEKSWKEIRAEYKKSAVLGDYIYPEVRVEESRTLVTLKNKEGQIYALVEFFE